MVRIFIIFIIMAFGTSITAQNIVEYRYWWNDDVNTLSNVMVTGSQNIDLNAALSTGSLALGHHRVTLQFRDDNDEWSAPYTAVFQKNLQLTQWEYWFDDDIANRVTMTNPPTELQNISTSIDASGLEAGYHRLSVHSLTDNMENSTPYTQVFLRKGGDLTQWQYWFNDDINTRVNQSISPPSAVLDLITTIDCSLLANGSNTITWRSADGADSWSVPITYPFDVVTGISEIGPLEELMIFPNPTSDQLYLRLESSTSFQANVDVIDQKGAVVLTKSAGISAGSDVLNFDVSRLRSGVYQMRIITEDGFVARKFIKR